MVQFALVAPLLFLLLFGLIELGRLGITSMTVANDAREGARYGIASGAGNGGEPRYADCDGVRNAVRSKSVMFVPGDGNISVTYDHGPATAAFLTCSGTSVNPADIASNDRIIVTVSHTFHSFIPFFNMSPLNLTATEQRTIVKDL